MNVPSVPTPPPDAAARGRLAGRIAWTVAACGSMAVLGAAAAMAKDQFRLFAAVAEQGWGVLGSGAARRALDVGKIVTSAAGFGVAGAAVPWLCAWIEGRRGAGAGTAAHAGESLGAYARWMLAGLLGLTTLAWFAGFRHAGGDAPNDYKVIWPVVVRCAVVAAAAGVTFEVIRRGGGGAVLAWAGRAAPWAGRAVAATALAYAVLFSGLSVARHHAFGTDLHDLGLYDQMLWALPRGHGFRVTTWQDHAYDLRRHGNNFAAEHFMPALLLLAPLRLAWAGAEVLLVAQSWWLAAAALALFAAARERLRSPLLAAALAAGWLLHPLVQQTNLKDFHADALAPVFLFAMVVAWSRRRPLLYAGMLGAFFCCKEETSLLAAGWAAFLLSRGEWRWGAATLAAAAFHYGLVIKWLIPATRDGEPLRHLYRYAHLAGGVEPQGLGEMIRWSALHPFEVFRSVATHERVRSLLLLLAPVAFLPLAAPRTWLMLVVPFGAALLSNWFIQYRLELHYGISSVTFAFAASIFALERWAPAPEGAPEGAPEPDAAAAGRSGEGADTSRAARAAAAVALLALGVLLWHQYGRTPLAKGYDPLDYLREPRYATAREFLAALPPDAAVAATSAVGVHLTGRENLFMFPDLPPETEFIFVDSRAAGVLFETREEYAAALRALLASPEWGVWTTGYRDGYLILRRGQDRGANDDVAARLDVTVRGD